MIQNLLIAPASNRALVSQISPSNPYKRASAEYFKIPLDSPSYLLYFSFRNRIRENEFQSSHIILHQPFGPCDLLIVQ